MVSMVANRTTLVQLPGVEYIVKAVAFLQGKGIMGTDITPAVDLFYPLSVTVALWQPYIHVVCFNIISIERVKLSLDVKCEIIH